MSHFLSVDIDFWVGSKNVSIEPSLDVFLAQLTSAAQKQHIPITAVDSHQQMLPLVNASTARTLINIDAHSDLTDDKIDFLQCGTWVSFVKWRKEGQYCWITNPCMKNEGDCNGDAPIFCPRSIRSDLSDWKQLSRNVRKNLPPIEQLIANCTEISVCKSPRYAEQAEKSIFDNWLKYYQIKYLPYRGPKKSVLFGGDLENTPCKPPRLMV